MDWSLNPCGGGESSAPCATSPSPPPTTSCYQVNDQMGGEAPSAIVTCVGGGGLAMGILQVGNLLLVVLHSVSLTMCVRDVM